MDNNLDNLKRLLESIKTIGFFGRLFSWKKIKNQLIDASTDLQKVITNSENLRETVSKLEVTTNGLSKDLEQAKEELIRKDSAIEKLNLTIQDSASKISSYTSDLSAAQTTIKNHEGQINSLSSDNRLLSEKNTQFTLDNKKLAENAATNTQTITDLTKRKNELDIELAKTQRDLNSVQIESSEIKKQNTQLLKDEEFRKEQHSNSLAALQKIQDQIQNERSKEIEERNLAGIERMRKLKETWSNHQEAVSIAIKSLCQKHTVEYVIKVPFKGDPDNTLMICNEHVVFDAKSPGSDDLTNFPNYLRDQAEKAKKYAKQENVKSDIFFVIPSNTLESLEVFVHRYSDHNVYVIPVHALEPIILSLKKIEEYEFAEQLSPEDRENICRVLGRFAHLSKRRIQVDSFFAKQFIELAYKCEADLPKDILESVIDFEKAGVLNPPLERRAKAIPLAELEKENKKINQDATGRGILIADENISKTLNDLPLYKTTND
ncbi:MAG TPA: hypothetical protein VK483_01380 [Chitinophagaceae bacterium]|nr:hypothetical protein [Chitinophagaceae bacterium]